MALVCLQLSLLSPHTFTPTCQCLRDLQIIPAPKMPFEKEQAGNWTGTKVIKQQ